jgi:hypothetical protein
MVMMPSWVMNISTKSGPVQSIAGANAPVLRRRQAKAQSKFSKQPARVRTRRLSELEPAAVMLDSSMVKVRFSLCLLPLL